MESAVINLKAELQKRKAKLNAEKLAGAQNDPKLKPFKAKNSQENVPVKGTTCVEKDGEESKMLEKSRTMLEKKAALYDQIKSGCDVLENDELNEKFLVNFQKKVEDSVLQEKEFSERRKEQEVKENLDSDEEWVEYVDALGRTRRCLQKDLDYMKERDREMMPEPPKPPDLVELEKAKLHEKWDKIEEESKEKRSLHYQDILFDEAREHGVGFMPFSRNEAERESQREILNNLRQETKKAEVTSKAARKEADKRMTDRLTKVRQRKRLKLGLPIKDLYEEKLATPPSSEDETVVESLPEPVIAAVPAKQKAVREWDVGKATSVMDQMQWVQSRRKLREEEFAPPQSYSGN